jgi:hypothetical protein
MLELPAGSVGGLGWIVRPDRVDEGNAEAEGWIEESQVRKGSERKQGRKKLTFIRTARGKWKGRGIRKVSQRMGKGSSRR